MNEHQVKKVSCLIILTRIMIIPNEDITARYPKPTPQKTNNFFPYRYILCMIFVQMSTWTIFFSRMDKHKKGKKQPSEWSKTGSFMHKPDRGWIHPDAQIKPDAGVCYGVRVSSSYLPLL